MHPKKFVVVLIAVVVALLHFVTGPQYAGPFPVFANGYLIDILLPMALYFLLCLVPLPFLKPRHVKAILVLVFACAVEFAQFIGLPLLGRTYDPLDLLMYTLGILLAALLDSFVFPTLFGFWDS